MILAPNQSQRPLILVTQSDWIPAYQSIKFRNKVIWNLHPNPYCSNISGLQARALGAGTIPADSCRQIRAAFIYLGDMQEHWMRQNIHLTVSN